MEKLDQLILTFREVTAFCDLPEKQKEFTENADMLENLKCCGNCKRMNEHYICDITKLEREGWEGCECWEMAK